MSRQSEFAKLRRVAELKGIPITVDNLVDLDLYLKGVERLAAVQRKMLSEPPLYNENLMDAGSSYILAATQRLVQTKQHQVIERLNEGDISDKDLAELHGMLQVLSHINELLLVGVNAASR